MDDLQSLRSAIEPQGSKSYPRPELSSEESQRLTKAARKINAIPDQMMRFLYVSMLAIENARLLKECNEHRAARGLEQLPGYDPENVR